MRRRLQILLLAPALVALIGCSSSEEAKKEEAKKEATAAPKKDQAPDVFQVNLDTSKGLIVLEVHRDWSPNGADHFYELVKAGFYDGVRFYRNVKGFMVQFGINGDPQTHARWANVNLPDDPVKMSNLKGFVTYATAGPRTRSTQMFINLANNQFLDQQGFSPFARVTAGMDVVNLLYNGYGDMPQQHGQGPDPGLIEAQGNAYLTSHFPKLDFIKKATIQ